MPLLWDSLQLQLQAVPSCLFTTPVYESLKNPYTVGVAVRCEPRRGSSATPPLIPASKIGRQMPVDFDAYSFYAHLRPKSPKFRLNVIVGYIAYLADKTATTGEILAHRAETKKTAGFYSYDLNCVILYSIFIG